LTGLERDKIAQELQQVAVEIRNYLELLASREKLYALMRSELVEIRERFATPRRTEIVEDELETDIEELIQREDMAVTVTHGGYVKRVPVAAYRAQRRGGRGRSGMTTRDDDFVSTIFVANTHTPVLFFTSRGIVHKLKVWRLPLGAPNARGKAFVNLLPLQEDESITTVMPMPEDEASWSKQHVMFATARGGVRRNELSAFVNINQGGKIAMKFEGADEGDRLIAAQVCTDEQDVLLATRLGKAIRFPVTAVRVFNSRSSTGVRGIALAAGDAVISMTLLDSGRATTEEREAYLRAARVLRQQENGEAESGAADETNGNGAPNGAAAGSEEEGEAPVAQIALSAERFAELAARENFLLTVASTGFGKRTSAYEYRVTGRGGKGVDLMNLPGDAMVAAAFPVAPRDQIMLMTDGGTLIRCPVADIRIAGRNTRGVRIVAVAEGEKVVSVAHLVDDAEADAATGK
jgi:DNA gyrase subunit A